MKKIIAALVVVSSCALITGCGWDNCGGGCGYTTVQYTTTSCCGAYTSTCCGSSW